MNALIKGGPYTVVLVFSHKCPHCVTYMPLWNQLCGTKGRKANMISMESGVYEKTPMAAKKQVTGVPTVLYVNDQGVIEEVEQPRNLTAMTNTVVSGSNSSSGPNQSSSYNLSDESVSSGSESEVDATNTNTNTNTNTTTSETPFPMSEITPASSEKPNPLHATPATPVQRGGNPWAAFLLTASQAAPAAALLGAYSMLPNKRSSGLGAPRRTRRKNRKDRK